MNRGLKLPLTRSLAALTQSSRTMTYAGRILQGNGMINVSARVHLEKRNATQFNRAFLITLVDQINI